MLINIFYLDKFIEDIRILFDENMSKNGALLFLKKTVKKRTIEDSVEYQRPIYTPHALPLFRDKNTMK